MNIKANRPAPEPTQPVDIFNEGMEGYVEETSPVPVPKERKTSNIVLVILGVFLLAFIVTMIVIFCVKGSVPDTLIMCTMGGSGLEALVLAGIKVSKVLAGGNLSSDPSDGVG